MADQARRLRVHPSVFVWLYGSDGPPPADVEKMYLRVLKEHRWPNPALSSASESPTTVTGPSGVKMTGPYEYVPPNYWLTDTKAGGAHGFNTETSPGPAIPPLESLKRFLPADHLWPIDDVLELPRRKGALHDDRCLRQRGEPPLREGREPGRLPPEVPGHDLRGGAGHVRGLRAEQVRLHGRDPVDAQQRLAVDHLAPVRLLPAARPAATSARRRPASRSTCSTPTTTAPW